ncbi:16S rRNA (adenine(1518)-N(6)/adenine(1519)-N(6))-dimethyltransferase RsmA [Candidatus Rhabdochlamydia porcellionis]|jgi:16S rRNA (adenine1518-N6/adenine1519-N6)-dimethyltransferase|uniref:Ribosomal RNA small subunit methyltransferase A n=1 Tax=Candidatus Rhabdochlamydia porcellionis TaxID=225148 RepID=A0ABX8YYG0_9BACT|nr:16S rRNA (adenine(1518)-N(6)/adenine(1519)-N(6))-dimethyltransferase RsmA [Candidatus Rhabdochlamydia porcellionis]QZA58294.1 Ribosomal RNA small subunit methyltransferase A [Candidatus Rhabdochlamydia porcellionis]
MSIYKPSVLKEFLRFSHIHPKKALSQNFLIDGNIIRKIIDAAQIQAGNIVLEIGPGPGALTEALLTKEAIVTAIEKDPMFAEQLYRLQDLGNLIIERKDFLLFDLEKFLDSKKDKIKVVANLPYHITTPILLTLLPHYDKIDTLTLMVQKEYADRMVASPKTPNYSHLSLLVSFFCQAKSLFTINPNCFFPKPKVKSAVVHCKLNPPALKDDIDAFFVLTRSAFQQKRKMLRSSLRFLACSKLIEQVLQTIRLPITARPEELNLQEFISLFIQLKHACLSKQN